MPEIQRWHCPGREQSKDRPLLIYPAAGWYVLKNKQGLAGPGWLVTHPGDPVTSAGRRVGYYLRNPEGQLVLAWAQDYDRLDFDQLRGTVIVRGPLGDVQIVQYMDNVAGLLNGFTVQEWQDPRQQPYPASDAVVQAIAAWEAIERPW